MELQRRVVGDNRVICGLRGYQVRIGRERTGCSARRQRRVQASVNSKHPPARDVLCEDVLRGVGAPPSLARVRRVELRVREDRMLDTLISSSCTGTIWLIAVRVAA